MKWIGDGGNKRRKKVDRLAEGLGDICGRNTARILHYPGMLPYLES